MGCTVEEIAALLKIGRSTFFDHVRDDAKLANAIETGRALGRETLRRWQWHAAEKGDKTMLVWLGKQMLGQTDRNEIATPPDRPIEVRDANGSPLEIARRIAFILAQATGA